ncbi:hypothetical protein F5Y18DRAFT_429328 [Xylariaceae sp. FL1019]|nr:hypothetical protein F5Y18DRAFT_429328 [Xylariaceae sp. FL1019]
MARNILIQILERYILHGTTHPPLPPTTNPAQGAHSPPGGHPAIDNQQLSMAEGHGRQEGEGASWAWVEGEGLSFLGRQVFVMACIIIVILSWTITAAAILHKLSK